MSVGPCLNSRSTQIRSTVLVDLIPCRKNQEKKMLNKVLTLGNHFFDFWLLKIFIHKYHVVKIWLLMFLVPPPFYSRFQLPFCVYVFQVLFECFSSHDSRQNLFQANFKRNYVMPILKTKLILCIERSLYIIIASSQIFESLT